MIGPLKVSLQIWWGTESWFVQIIVSPLFIFIVAGLKEKLSIATLYIFRDITAEGVDVVGIFTTGRAIGDTGSKGVTVEVVGICAW